MPGSHRASNSPRGQGERELDDRLTAEAKRIVEIKAQHQHADIQRFGRVAQRRAIGIRAKIAIVLGVEHGLVRRHEGRIALTLVEFKALLRDGEVKVCHQIEDLIGVVL